MSYRDVLWSPAVYGVAKALDNLYVCGDPPEYHISDRHQQMNSVEALMGMNRNLHPRAVAGRCDAVWCENLRSMMAKIITQ